MRHRYSVQFERYESKGNIKLRGSLIKLSDSFYHCFSVVVSSGYVSYQNLFNKASCRSLEFWYSVVDALDDVEAYQEAVLALLSADIEEPFPAGLELTYDKEVREF